MKTNARLKTKRSLTQLSLQFHDDNKSKQAKVININTYIKEKLENKITQLILEKYK
jgi:hypothetical protein